MRSTNSDQRRIEGDSSGAEADFRKGLDLAPNFGPGLRAYAEYLFQQNRYEDTLAVIDRARLVDPLSAENHYRKGEVLRIALHGTEAAATLYLQALAVKPDFYPAYTRLAQVRFPRKNRRSNQVRREVGRDRAQRHMDP